MKKRRIQGLTLAIMMGMMAVVPASAQVSQESGMAGDPSLALLISVNRLELTHDQMVSLLDILTELLESKAGVSEAEAAFKEAMIGFNGTADELDVLLRAFREDQGVLAEALQESIASSLDRVRDLLTINQGMVLREELPQLLGEGRSQSMPYDRVQMQGSMMRPSGRLQQRMTTDRGNESCLSDSQMGGQTSYWRVVPSEAGEQEMRSGRRPMGMMQQGLRGQQVSPGEQLVGSSDFEALREQMRDRLSERGEQVPEELRVQLEERLQTHLEGLSERITRGVARMNLQTESERAQTGTSSLMEQSSLLRQSQMQYGNRLFAFLEQLAEVLELKLEALE